MRTAADEAAGVKLYKQTGGCAIKVTGAAARARRFACIEEARRQGSTGSCLEVESNISKISWAASSYPSWSSPIHLHVHVSGSGGTSFCSLARRQQGLSGPPYNCLLPYSGQADWRAVLNCKIFARSCESLWWLYARYNWTFGMVETLAPHWMGCDGVRYTFLMAEPVTRVLKYAYAKLCVTRTGNLRDANCSSAETTLRSWYRQPFVLNRTDEFMGTPAISNYNVRMLLDRQAFFVCAST